jgi:hypothetical protein
MKWICEFQLFLNKIGFVKSQRDEMLVENDITLQTSSIGAKC